MSSNNDSSFTSDCNMDDTWHVAIGARYRIAEPWLLSIGFAYNASPFDHAEDRTPDMPLDRQIRYATGL